jgi:hypothetical protein
MLAKCTAKKEKKSFILSLKSTVNNTLDNIWIKVFKMLTILSTCTIYNLFQAYQPTVCVAGSGPSLRSQCFCSDPGGQLNTDSDPGSRPSYNKILAILV